MREHLAGQIGKSLTTLVGALGVKNSDLSNWRCASRATPNRSHWEFGDLDYMNFHYASINDVPIKEADRKFRWSSETCGTFSALGSAKVLTFDSDPRLQV